MKPIKGTWTVALAVVTLAVGILIGIPVNPEGQMRVPTDKGVPADLPHWACQELVDARLDRYLDDRESYERARTYEKVGKEIIGTHYYAAPDLGTCRDD